MYADILRDVRHMTARAAPDLADWLVTLELEGKASRTLYGYPREIALLLRTWPDLAFNEFRAEHINECLAMKPRQSRHQTRSIWNGWFAWGKLDGRLDTNPMDRVPKVKQPPRRPKDIFSEAERALLEALPSPDGPLCTIMFGTGLRKTECINLRREHIDLNRTARRVIGTRSRELEREAARLGIELPSSPEPGEAEFVPAGRLMVYDGKGGKDRVVPLFFSVQQAIAELDLHEQLKPTDHLWYTTRGRRRLRRDPIGDTTMDRWWGGDRKRGTQGVVQKAGIRYLNIHQTRHTFGHWLRELGFDIEERKEFMGHEDIRTTERYYGRVTIEDVAAKVREMVV
jgi:integrase